MGASIEKGTFYLMISQAIFFVTGVLIYFFLGRWFLSPKEFGVYGVIIAFISLIYAILNAGIQQSVSKFVSERNDLADEIRRKAIAIQLVIGVAVFLAVFLLSDYIALLMNDLSLSPFIKFSSILILTHPIYSVFTGYLNGLRLFSIQSILDSFYFILKLAMILLLVLLGFGVWGAIGGFAISSIAIALISVIFIRGKKSKGGFDTKRILIFGSSVIGFSLSIALLNSVDILLVKSLSPPATSSLLVGYYTAAYTLSRLPMVAIGAFTLVLFPLVSYSTFKGDLKKSGFYIRNAIRYSLLFVVPIVALIAASSRGLLSLVYSSRYVEASGSLFFLAFSAGFFALFLMLITIISGSGKPKVSMLIGLVTATINIALDFALIPRFSIFGAAMASFAALLFGLAVSAAFVFMKFNALVRLSSFIRISFAGAIIFFASLFLPFYGILLALKCILLIVAYAGILIALKELGRRDFSQVAGAFFAKKGGARDSGGEK